ncbi:hypothetical protein F5B20DRAFT_204283 [Whalleya microplaca]|nr:hypothetical protein F5B20DRAFT_204283 [Whalleya microplaca]
MIIVLNMDFPSDANTLRLNSLEHLMPQEKYARSFEWEPYKETIKTLYLEQNKTVEEIRRTMSEHHKFYATTTMYKKRINAWRFNRKRLRENDVRDLLHQKRKRDAAGKASKFIVRGRDVGFERVQSYLKRKPKNAFNRLEDISGHQMSSGTVICRTPSPSVPAALPSPPQLCWMEETITAMRDYAQSFTPNWPYRITLNGRPATDLEFVTLISNAKKAWGHMYMYFSNDTALSPNTVTPICIPILNTSANQICDAIKHKVPSIVFDMLSLFSTTRSKHPILLQKFRKHIVDLCYTFLGTKHPLTITLNHLIGATIDEREEFRDRAYCLLAQELPACLGPDHLLAVEALKAWIRRSSELNPNVALRRLENWLLAYQVSDDTIEQLLHLRAMILAHELIWNDSMEQILQTRRAIENLQCLATNPYLSSFLVAERGLTSMLLGNYEDAECDFLVAYEIMKQCQIHDVTIQVTILKFNLPIQTIILLALGGLYKVAKQPQKLAVISQKLRDVEDQMLQDCDPLTDEAPIPWDSASHTTCTVNRANTPHDTTPDQPIFTQPQPPRYRTN